jgi:hypothetical protein
VGWLVGGVWIGAVVLAAVVLGFCAYELTWKAQRVRRDLGRLTGLGEQVTAVQQELQIVERRIADAAESSG